MKHCAFTFLLILFFGCGDGSQNSKSVIENDFPDTTALTLKAPTVPKGAITANFNGDNHGFYAYVKKIDAQNEITTIAFEGEKYPQINISESIGALLQPLKLGKFDRDLLLVNAKLKDTSFNEYYLFKLQDSNWRQIINRFDIHKSNMSDTLVPIQINPKDSTQLFRYYSVFDLDVSNGKKYQWILLRESVAIEE